MIGTSSIVRRTPMWAALSTRTEIGLRSLVGGQPELPGWVLALADGDDEGYFGPGSATWRVHRDLALLAGGLRSLLLQMLHPAAVAGVDQHSTYRQNGLERVARTNRWVMVTTFGSKAAANREAARVRGMHRRVRGSYFDAAGTSRTYRADDGHLLRWVHIAFTDSCLTAFRNFSSDPLRWDRGLADDYVAEWSIAGDLVGVIDPPRSRVDLAHALLDFDAQLAWTPAADNALQFLRNPPLPASARPAYQALLQGAAATLDPGHRRLIPLPDRGDALPRHATRMMLGTLRSLVSDHAPGLEQAQIRLQRLAAERAAGSAVMATMATGCRQGAPLPHRREAWASTRRPRGRP